MPPYDELLSFGEERLWRGEQPQPDTTAFVECPLHVPLILRMTGPLDPALLKASVASLVERHGVLRSRFIERDGSPVRVVGPSAGAPLAVTDLRRLSETKRDSVLAELLAHDVNAPFDLATGPLVRFRLIKLGSGAHIFAGVVHHIVFDGWSKHILAGELARLYQSGGSADAAGLPPVRAGYQDYVRWQRERLESDGGRKSLAYWTDRLTGAPEIRVPSDCHAGAGRSTRSAAHRFVIQPERAAGLRALASVHGATPGVAMAAVFNLLLFKLTGVEDIVLGMPSADRNRYEFDGVVGLFLNLVALRTDLSGNPSFAELLHRVRRTFIDAYDRADTPYSCVLSSMSCGREGAGPVRVVFNFMTSRAPKMKIPGIVVENVDVEVNSPSCADFSVHMLDKAGTLGGFILYKADQFSPEYMRGLVSRFESIMSQVIEAPERRIRDNVTCI